MRVWEVEGGDGDDGGAGGVRLVDGALLPAGGLNSLEACLALPARVLEI